MSPGASFIVLAHALAPLAVAGLWQGLAISLTVALCVQWTRGISATYRFGIWSGAFIAVALVPVLPALFGLFTSSGAASAGAAAASHAWLRFDVRWTVAIAALWLILSAMRAGDLLFHVFRLRWLWRTANPIETANPGVSSRTFQLCSTQFLDRPSVIGFFRPRILIPDWLLPRLSADELNQIVLHESTHLTRRDDWTNLLQQLFLIVFPLNPGLWWID